jgi:hypothetical protein
MGLTHLICACLEADNLPFAEIYGFRGCETLWTEIGSFNYAALASFATLFANVPLYYDHDCLRRYKKLISRKMGEAKKNYVTFFSKYVRFHIFRSEKAFKVRFSPIIFLFIFLRFSIF